MNNIQLINQSITAPELMDMLNIEIVRGRINCPFHNDSRPSMKVYEDHFYCFTCGTYKKVISFIMSYLNLPFKDALKWLADKTNITLDTQDNKDLKYLITNSEINEVTDIDMTACIEYHKQLLQDYINYLDINKQHGFLLENHENDREKNEQLWLNLHQYGIDTVFANIKYFKKVEKILKENWETVDIKEISSTIKSGRAFSKSLHNLLKQNERYILC